LEGLHGESIEGLNFLTLIFHFMRLIKCDHYELPATYFAPLHAARSGFH